MYHVGKHKQTFINVRSFLIAFFFTQALTSRKVDQIQQSPAFLISFLKKFLK